MKKEKLSTRILSLLLVALTIMGIFPSAIMTASAGDYIPPPGTAAINCTPLQGANENGTLKNPPPVPEQIRLDKYYKVGNDSGEYGRYYVQSMGQTVSHFTCDFDIGSNNIVKGFCTEYGKHVGKEYEGKYWSNPTEVTTADYSEEMIRFMDYYAYQQTLHKELHEFYFPELGPCNEETDKKIREDDVGDSPYKGKFKYDQGWTQANLDEIANQIQLFVWAAMKDGPNFKPFSDSSYRAQACADRVSLCKSFDYPITADKANEWFDQIYSVIMSPDSVIPHFKHYIYHYDSATQNMLVSLIPTTHIDTDEYFYVKIQKLMEGAPLAGAKFQIYRDSTCKVPVTGGQIISDINGNAVSNRLKVPSDIVSGTTFDVWVKETEAPEGVGISDQAVKITVDPSVNNSPDNPATSAEAVFEDKGIPDKYFSAKSML